MSKMYTYKNLSFPVADDALVTLTVTFAVPSTFGGTTVNIPGPNDPEIGPEGGSKVIGNGAALRGQSTVILSTLHNLIPEIPDIEVEYFLNGKSVVKHSNPKTEEENPIVILIVNFPKA